MHTEEEAKQKWCPMSRCGNEAGCNTSSPVCQGSSCMMWRWTTQRTLVDMKLIQLGYCGLAGKPEVMG